MQVKFALLPRAAFNSPCSEAVRAALACGYRLIDTASIYKVRHMFPALPAIPPSPALPAIPPSPFQVAGPVLCASHHTHALSPLSLRPRSRLQPSLGNKAQRPCLVCMCMTSATGFIRPHVRVTGRASLQKQATHLTSATPSAM